MTQPLDSIDRHYLVGAGTSLSNFPFVDPGGDTYYEDNLDDVSGFIARFSPNLNLEWCTLFGGNELDRIHSIDIGTDDRFVVSGETKSTDLNIVSTPNTTQDFTLNGTRDWFLATFDAQGQQLWGTYEGGDSDEQTPENMHSVAYSPSNSIYFAYPLSGLGGINFVDPGGESYFKDASGVQSFYEGCAIVRYDNFSYAPIWRTLLSDGYGVANLFSLTLHDDKIIVSGSTTDGSIPLVSGGSTLYSSSITPSMYSNLDAFLMLFGKNNYELIHSTYFGGTDGNTASYAEAIREVAMNEYNELFAFGSTESVYFEDESTIDFGIPVKNNMVSGAYYQDNLNNEFMVNSPSSDGFGFKLCLEGTSVSDGLTLEVDGKDSYPLVVYPNPAQMGASDIQIRVFCDHPMIMLDLFDVSGKSVLANTIQEKQSTLLQISDNSIESGVYILQVQTEHGNFQQKLVLYE